MNLNKICLFLILHLFTHASSQNVLKLGMTINLSPELDDFMITSAKYIRAGLQAFEYWCQKNGPFEIDGETYEIEFYYETDNGFNTEDVYQSLINEKGVDILIGGFAIANHIAMANVAERNGKIAIGTSSASEIFFKNRSFIYSVYPTSYERLKSLLPYYRISGAKSATMLIPHNASSGHACINFDLALEDNFIYDYNYVTFYNYEFDDGGKYNMTDVIKRVIELDNDILIHCGYNITVLNEINQLMKKFDYTPKGGISANQVVVEEGDIINAYWSRNGVVMDFDVNYTDSPFIGSRKNYEDLYDELFGKNPDFHRPYIPGYGISYYSFIAGELILNAIYNAKSLNLYDIDNALGRTRMNTMIGLISYAADNSILNPGIGYQRTNKGYYNLISPGSVSNSTLVYPMPKWNERIKNNSIGVLQILVMIFTCIMILNSIGWIIYIYLYRKHKIIISSSHIFLISMLIGSIIIYISLFFWHPLNNTYESFCYLYVWILSIGFTIFFGSMVVKVWRIALLFGKRLKLFKVSNKKVAVFLSILVMIDMLLLCIWSIITKATIKEEIIDLHRISLNYNMCYYSSKAGFYTGISLLIVFKIFIIVLGAIYSLKVRNIPYKNYDESKIIAFCIYNIILSSIIIAIIESMKINNRELKYGLRSFLILISTSVTVNVFFINKPRAIKNYDSKNTTDTVNSNNMSDIRMQSVEIDDNKDINYSSKDYNNNTEDTDNNDIETLIKENKSLKKQNAKLIKENDELKNEIKMLKEAN